MTLPTKSQKIRRDADTCLSIVATLQPFLLRRDGWEESNVTMDKEVQTSAEATFISCCNQLDNLLARMGNKDDEEKLEDQVLKSLEANAKASENSIRPSVVYRPAIGVDPSTGLWAVWYGDRADMEKCVYGIGATPEEAMLDFDAEWRERKIAVADTTKSPKPTTKKSKK